MVRESGIPSVAVKCVDIRGTPAAKAASDCNSTLRHESVVANRLDTLVIHAVNDEHLCVGPRVRPFRSAAKLTQQVLLPGSTLKKSKTFKGIDAICTQRSYGFQLTNAKNSTGLDILLTGDPTGLLLLGQQSIGWCMVVVSSCREMLSPATSVTPCRYNIQLRLYATATRPTSRR